MLRDEYVVVVQQLRYVERLWPLDDYVREPGSSRSQIWRLRLLCSDDAEFVYTEGPDDCFEKLGLRVVKLR